MPCRTKVFACRNSETLREFAALDGYRSCAAVVLTVVPPFLAHTEALASYESRRILGRGLGGELALNCGSCGQPD